MILMTTPLVMASDHLHIQRYDPQADNTQRLVTILTYVHVLRRNSIVRSFVRLLLRAGVQPTLDPSTETIETSNALAQERGGKLADWLLCASVCMMCREGG